MRGKIMPRGGRRATSPPGGTERETLAATQQTIAVLLRARGGHDPRWD